jgi:protein-S-isoprenylcysteine O-methyltransferase Ste14
MDRTVYVLILLNLAFIGALPRIFFRPGRLNARWWATALPFFLAALLMLAGIAGAIGPVLAMSPFTAALVGSCAVLCSAASVAIIDWTLATHRLPLSLWHQDDQPAGPIVMTGPYRYVRHPFYAAFILALLGALLALPHWSTLALLVYGTFQLDRTARHEERRILDGPAGEAYTAYMRRTGRFVPASRTTTAITESIAE